MDYPLPIFPSSKATWTPVCYAAFVRDPDGNNIKAVFRGG
jgi:hypothetical protein